MAKEALLSLVRCIRIDESLQLGKHGRGRDADEVVRDRHQVGWWQEASFLGNIEGFPNAAWGEENVKREPSGGVRRLGEVLEHSEHDLAEVVKLARLLKNPESLLA